MPVLVHVSQATLLFGSSLRQASRMASETCAAHILSPTLKSYTFEIGKFKYNVISATYSGYLDAHLVT